MTNSIKFYYNGIRVNGEKTLIKCSYSLDNHRDYDECVTLYADSYSDKLPRDLFEVVNESDSYTDYFEDDHATLTPEHPLYKYARYAAVKAKIRDLKRHIEYMEKNVAGGWYKASEVEAKKAELAKCEGVKDPGHPTAEDLEKIRQMRLDAENARIAAQHEAELKAREESTRKRNEVRRFIEKIAAEHPIREGEPVVTINWSEHPAFYSWEDDELKLSVAAAEIILTHFDKEVHAEEDRGYDKTKFTIEYVNEDGEQDTYVGRYDLGDDDGGMIEHIRAWGRYLMEKGHFGNGHPTDEDRETGKAIVEIADMLNRYTVNGKIISVALAPWLENIVKAKKEATEKETEMVMGVIDQMGVDELAAAIMSIDPKDEEREDLAEFLVKQLALRNVRKALAVYEEWQREGGA